MAPFLPRLTEPEADDCHNLPAWEDEAHVPSPACLCDPLYLGRDAEGRRVFEHRQVEPQGH